MTQNPPKHRRPWSDLDDDLLGFLWGAFKLPIIAKRLGRTEWAIATRAKSLGLGPFSRGRGVSLREFERYSGFSTTKIKSAVKSLNMKLKRIVVSDPVHGGKHRTFVIDEEQQDILLKCMMENEVLYQNQPGTKRTTRGVWGIGKKPKRCRDCKKASNPHFAKGRCKLCYVRRHKRKTRMKAPIRKFTGDYHFLSNFYLADIWFEEAWYASVEHAFQAAKTTDMKKRTALQLAANSTLSKTPGYAKSWGRRVALRPDWEDVKFEVMEALLREKFTRHDALAKKLLDTGRRKIVEENTWGDRIWGVCGGVGENHLGKLLMKIREELRQSRRAARSNGAQAQPAGDATSS